MSFVRVALAVLLAFLPGCTFDFSDTDLGNNQTQGSGGTGPTPIVTPSPSQGCPVQRLAGGIFGDVGSVQCAGRVANTVPVGCVAVGTVTPLLVDGTRAAPLVHGQSLTLDIIEGSANVRFVQDDDNVYNYTFWRIAPGLVTLRATLVPPGCPSLQREYNFP